MLLTFKNHDMKFLLCVSFILVLYTSFKQQHDGKKFFQQLDALQGTWKMSTSKGVLYEGWKRINDTLLQGGSCRINENDTIFFERVSLKCSGGEIFYVPVVKENNMRPVKLKLTSCNNNSFVFENPEHDFPKRVVYEIVSTDSLHAYIDDGINNTSKRSDYYYKRIN